MHGYRECLVLGSSCDSGSPQVFQHTLAVHLALQHKADKLGTQLCVSNMVGHVDVCPLNDALWDNLLDSLVQAGNGM